jgi:FtsH-binding integral membrane protein
MESLARSSRAVWWAFTVAGAGAIVAAAIAVTGVVGAPFAAGLWLLATAVVLLVALVRSPGGVREGIPFAGVALVSLLLGIAGVVLPREGTSVALVMIGIWAVVAGAAFLAISSIALARRVPDAGLRVIAWATIGVGIATSSAPVFGFGSEPLAAVAALVAVGVVGLVAATRLRIMPDEAPPAVSKREQRRRERGAGGS